MKRERFLAFTTWGLALLLLAGPAAAQVQVNTQAAVPPNEAPVQVRDGAIELSLNDAVETALRRNLGLVIERYTRTQARLGVQQALGIYDLLTSAELQANSISNPPTSVTNPTDSNFRQLTLGLSQAIPTGGQL